MFFRTNLVLRSRCSRLGLGFAEGRLAARRASEAPSQRRPPHSCAAHAPAQLPLPELTPPAGCDLCHAVHARLRALGGAVADHGAGKQCGLGRSLHCRPPALGSARLLLHGSALGVSRAESPTHHAAAAKMCQTRKPPPRASLLGPARLPAVPVPRQLAHAFGHALLACRACPPSAGSPHSATPSMPASTATAPRRCRWPPSRSAGGACGWRCAALRGCLPTAGPGPMSSPAWRAARCCSPRPSEGLRLCVCVRMCGVGCGGGGGWGGVGGGAHVERRLCLGAFVGATPLH